MWSEMCDYIPLPSGLDYCIEHDIAEYTRCAINCEKKDDLELAQSYKEKVDELRKRKKDLDNMSPIKRWWHCEKQYRKVQKRLSKSIKESKRILGI